MFSNILTASSRQLLRSSSASIYCSNKFINNNNVAPTSHLCSFTTSNVNSQTPLSASAISSNNSLLAQPKLNSKVTTTNNFILDQQANLLRNNYGTVSFNADYEKQIPQEDATSNKSSGILKLILKVLFGATLATVVTGLYVNYGYEPPVSILYLGESLEFQDKLDKEYGVPLSKIAPLCFEASFKTMFMVDKDDPLQAINTLLTMYPEVIFGYLLMASYQARIGDNEQAKKFLERAQRIVKLHPKKNEAFKQFVPTAKQFFERDWPSEFHTVVTDKVWALEAPFIAKDDDPTAVPLKIQASIVKLRDDSLIIVNPTKFNDDDVKKINSLTTKGVKAIITTTVGHGAAIAKASKIWPNAELYGTDEATKHEHPEINWTGFLSNDNQVFGDELQHIKLDGNIFNETVLFHKDSKCLVGFTDLVLRNDTTMKHNPNAMATYFFGLGLWRGKYNKNDEFVYQAYHIAFTSDKKKLRESMLKVLSLDFEHFTLGHGGIYHGVEMKHKFVQSLDNWLLNPANDVNFIHATLMPFAFLTKHNLLSFFIKMTTANQQKK